VTPVLERADCAYTAFYCEENVFHLAARPELAELERWAVFISNPAQACPLWQQRAAPEGRWVLWDYHVVLVVRDAGLQVYDLDTRLDFPTGLEAYLAATFPFVARLPADLAPRFRVVTAPELAATFASDRSHMRDGRGRFRKPPPAWPAIRAPGQPPTNLMRFIQMEVPFVGEVRDLESLPLL
jgi:hypothetical protein